MAPLDLRAGQGFEEQNASRAPEAGSGDVWGYLPKGGCAGMVGSSFALPSCPPARTLRVVPAAEQLASLAARCVCLLGDVRGGNLVLAFNHKVSVW